MLVTAPVDTRDYLTLQELMIFTGWDNEYCSAQMNAWRRSEHPLRVYYDGNPNLASGELEHPTLLFHIDDVIAHMLRAGVMPRPKYWKAVEERGGYRYIGGLQQDEQESDTDLVGWFREWQPEEEVLLQKDYPSEFLAYLEGRE